MRGSAWELKFDPKRFREEIKNDIDGPRSLPRPFSAVRGEQTRPKRIPRDIWRPSWVDLEAPQSSQGPPKSSPKEPERDPKRLQNHFWNENADFSNMLILLIENHKFSGARVSLGAQH